jgi:hypothetical protein
MSDFYEPWQPLIGQRVRVRASSECPNYRYGGCADGVVGIVTDVAPYAWLKRNGIEQPEHRFEVTFAGGGFDRHCALELEPIDHAPRAAAPGGAAS